MDDITRYIEPMNKLQDAINLPAIQAMQERNAAIQNALSTSPRFTSLSWKATDRCRWHGFLPVRK